MRPASALLVLHAHSGVHLGVGQESGTVDLPIQRERVTHYPVGYASSLKGALRQAVLDLDPAEAVATINQHTAPDHLFRGQADKDLELFLKLAFGPDVPGASEHAGALAVGDARLILFPMRSLRGTFAWLTCPFALKRLARDLADAGLPMLAPPKPPTSPGAPPAKPAPQIITGAPASKSSTGTGTPSQGVGKLTVADGRALTFQLANGVNAITYSEAASAPVPGAQPAQHVVVEEYPLSVQGPLNAYLAPNDLAFLRPAAELQQRLAVVSDNDFQGFVSFATEVVTRVRLNSDTKTVERGALWTEELLPAESVLAATIFCSDSRAPKHNGTPSISGRRLLDALAALTAGRFQIGGNETVGYGLCEARWHLALAPTPTTGGTLP